MSPIKPHNNLKTNKKQQVEEMFDGISASYDKANRFISLGMDMRWKKRLIKMLLQHRPTSVLDLATGTADLPLMMSESGQKNITGLDLSPGMLDVGKQRVAQAGKSEEIILLQGDSENLPFEDETFDAVTVSYGLRNYENLDKGLQETHRVLKKGGYFLILETSVPSVFPFKQGYVFFTRLLMPLIGRLFSGDENSYRYLSESASNFPFGNQLKRILETNGFVDIEVNPQFFGAASIYVCLKQ